MGNLLNWTDTHCHLNLPEFDADWQQVTENAAMQDVRRIILPGIDIETSEIARKMAEEHPAIFFACGIHPNCSATFQPEAVDALRALAAHPKCVAIGEIGLDYYREYARHSQQDRAFRAQLALAQELRKPVLIHCRKAFPDLFPILQEWQRGCSENYGVLHAFDETIVEMQLVTDCGSFLGIGGAYTYPKNQRRDEILQAVSLDKIMLETDAPYLTPVPHRGTRNEPAYIPLIARKVAAIRGMDLEELSQQINQNTSRFFGFS